MKNSIYKNFNLKNKTAVLTGSAGRLGNEFAHTFSNRFANSVESDFSSTKFNAEHCSKNKYRVCLAVNSSERTMRLL